ncbi:MAG: cytidine deaminase [Gemmatimonadaceae bacterium]
MSALDSGDAARQAAAAAMQRAYAPYSQFHVGAALVTRDGGVHVGCNVENASFPAGTCAERSAAVRAIASGAREFERLVIVTDGVQAAPPCGICRQVLAEFAPRLEIESHTTGGDTARWNLSELLPTPFTPLSMERS